MAVHTELTLLNQLLEICHDAERGFRTAAQKVTDHALKDLLHALADQRHQFASELAPHIHRLGGQALVDGTVTAAVHRGWMRVHGAASRNHDKVVLGDVARGERAALRAYKEALTAVLPPTARDLVERQHAAIEYAYTRIVALEDVRQAA